MKPTKTNFRIRGVSRGVFTLVLALGLPAFASPVFAADRENRSERAAEAAERMKQMAEELELTDAQKTEIREIMEAQRDKLEALRGDESLSRRKKLKKLRDLRETTRLEIRATLTPEQQKKFDAMPREKLRK